MSKLEFLSEEILSKAKSKTHAERYLKFIFSRNKRIISPNAYSERHHILPRSIWPKYQNLSEFPWNSIDLTPREHFLAHWILWKAYGGPMTTSFWYMASNNREHTFELNSKAYATLKESMISEKKQKVMIYKGNVQKYVYHHEIEEFLSDGWCVGMAEYNRENRKKLRKIHKGNEHKNVLESELEWYLSDGWSLGWGESTKRKIQKSLDSSSRRYVFKGDKTKYIKLSELDSFLNKGWSLGTSEKFKRARASTKKGLDRKETKGTYVYQDLAGTAKYLSEHTGINDDVVRAYCLNKGKTITKAMISQSKFLKSLDTEKILGKTLSDIGFDFIPRTKETENV